MMGAKGTVRGRFLRCTSILALAVVVGCAGPPKHPAWRNATGAEQYERLMWQAIHDKDWKQVERHLAPAFVGVDATGKAFNKATWLEHWKTVPIGDFSLGEVITEPEGADMVLTGILYFGPAQPGNALPRQGVRVMSVWQQVKGHSIMTATSLTQIK